MATSASSTLTCLAAPALGLALAVIMPTALLSADDYVVTDLGSLGSAPYAQVKAVNSLGHAVGYSYPDISPMWPHAFLWRDGAMTDLGTAPGTVNSFAAGINDSDQVIGWGQDESGNTTNWLWSNGTFTVLPMSAGGISNDGTVIGSAQVAPGSFHLMFWNGAAQDLGDIGGSYLVVHGLTNQHTTCGYRYSMPGFFYQDGAVADIGSLFDATYFYPYGINNGNDVIGQGTVSFDGFGSTWEAFIYNRLTGTRFLGSLTPGGVSSAWGINDQDQVVGYSTVDSMYSGINHAFLWELGTMFDLNDLIDPSSPAVGDLIEGVDINASSQIVANGAFGWSYSPSAGFQSFQHAYLLTPGAIAGGASVSMVSSASSQAGTTGR